MTDSRHGPGPSRSIVHSCWCVVASVLFVLQMWTFVSLKSQGDAHLLTLFTCFVATRHDTRDNWWSFSPPGPLYMIPAHLSDDTGRSFQDKHPIIITVKTHQNYKLEILINADLILSKLLGQMGKHLHCNGQHRKVNKLLCWTVGIKVHSVIKHNSCREVHFIKRVSNIWGKQKYWR